MKFQVVRIKLYALIHFYSMDFMSKTQKFF